jgi:ELWxxDGT repeat protein
MKKFFTIIITVIVTFMTASTALHAQNFHLLDINHSTDAYPANNFQFAEEQWENYTKYGYAVLKGIAYFTANDGISGEAIWRSDGTAAGTYKLKDTHPESLNERMYDLTVSGDKFFFKVDNLDYGQELWVSDGTSDGTFMVYYSGGSPMYYLTDVNGTLYFMQSLYGTADQLWKTDGTSGGTVMIENLNHNSGPLKPLS